MSDARTAIRGFRLGQRVRRLISLGQPWTHGDRGRLDRAAAALRRPVDRALLRRYGRFDDLRRIAAGAGAGDDGAPRVLVLALRSWPTHAAYETVIAQALRRRGAHVGLVTCGGGQPACELGRARAALPRPCDRCAWYTNDLIAINGVEAFRLADHLPWGADARRAPERAREGFRWSDATSISVPWFLKSSDPDAVPEGAAALADFEVSAEGVAAAAEAILARFRPDVVFLVNGLFTAEYVFAEAARAGGTRVVSYERSPRAGALFFSEDAPAPRYAMEAAWEACRNQPLTPEQGGALDHLIAGRAEGRGAHERYFDAPIEDRAAIAQRLDIAPDRRVLGLFSNLTWDSACLGTDIAFPSMADWVAACLSNAAALDDAVVVVRVHPSEARWGTREPLEPLVRARLGGELPANARFVAADEPLSSYALMAMSDLVLTYTTTVGLEAVLRRRPVAVAGETHYRGRGFTIDVERRGQLLDAMADPRLRVSEPELELARRYAFTFFFRKMVPMPTVRVHEEQVLGVADRLEPGADPYLDLVCDQILAGGDFMLPDELALPAPAATAVA